MSEAARLVSPVPDRLRSGANGAVLDYLAGKSAHSDVAEVLCRAAGSLDGARVYCADIQNYGFCVLERGGELVAFAYGMAIIGVRLKPADIAAAQSAGAAKIEIGERSWALFKLFGPEEFDIDDWLARAG